MSRSKKTRKQGKLTVFLPTGPSKTELLADPASRESRRKKALEQKRRQQRSLKKDGGADADTNGTAGSKRRSSRLKQDPAAVAEASRKLIEASESKRQQESKSGDPS
ncbi:hypothetical protein [Motiliproteus sediminis]|uniref:hypothetical protein n=1 Tax=Motiliproteus sediminis TaxID=1468178 RepID=UPI001AEFBF99|nr:hypothetical protein [Motiliproteus sediminis]